MNGWRDRQGAGRDVAVIGAGVVGLAVAALLGRAGFKVALVDALPAATFDPAGEYDLRVYALTRASERILAAAGAWDFIAGSRHGSFRSMEVWDEGSRGRIRFDSTMLAEAALGSIVEQNLIRHALERRIATLPDVEWLRPAALATWRADETALHLTLDDGRTFWAPLVVGADGARSRVRTLAGIGYERQDYDHHAIVCNVGHEQAHDDTARQRFLPTGPVAFLPLADARQSSIVWSTAPELAERLMALDDATFCAELTLAFEGRLGRVTGTGPRARFPLARASAASYVVPRVALIGDAAHSIHPLAGQGANLGLLDAATLADIVVAARESGADIGSLRVLRRHERWRRGENLAMQSLMTGFKDLFGASRPALRWLRGTGLTAVDRAGPLKNLIMRRAMGLTGDLPRYALPG